MADHITMEVMETTIAVAVAIDMAAMAIVREGSISLTVALPSAFLLTHPVKNSVFGVGALLWGPPNTPNKTCSAPTAEDVKPSRVGRFFCPPFASRHLLRVGRKALPTLPDYPIEGIISEV